MMAGLGSRFFVSETGIKTFSVGYPNQAPLDAFFALRRQYGLRPDNVERIVVRLPEDGPGIVSNSPMPNVNCQYLIATALVDGAVSFANSHSSEHMADPQIRAVMQRVQVVGDPKLNDPAAPRSGLVEVTLSDGRTVSHFTRFPPGTKENPVDTEAVNTKARDLMTPVLGAQANRDDHPARQYPGAGEQHEGTDSLTPVGLEGCGKLAGVSSRGGTARMLACWVKEPGSRRRPHLPPLGDSRGPDKPAVSWWGGVECQSLTSLRDGCYSILSLYLTLIPMFTNRGFDVFIRNQF